MRQSPGRRLDGPDVSEIPSREELEAAHCWEADDEIPRRPAMTQFRRMTRYHQAKWREANGHPIGSQPIAPPDGARARPVGGRLPLDYARATGATFLTAGALDAARARTSAIEPNQSIDHQRLWADLLSSARAIGLFSGAERSLLHDYLRVTSGSDEVVGIGIDPPPRQAYPRHQQDPNDTVAATDDEDIPTDAAEAPSDSYLDARGAPFRRRHRLYGNFALYGGRVDADNGCEEMLEYYDSYASQDGEVSLVLMGVKMMKLPDERYLRSAGVLPDRERMVAYEAADVTIAPAPDDLLAQPVLESLAVGTPVLANARNEAAVDHCKRANGGLYYANREEFVEALRLLTTNRWLCETLGENGRSYVRHNYRWDGVLGRFERLIAKARAR